MRTKKDYEELLRAMADRNLEGDALVDLRSLRHEIENASIDSMEWDNWLAASKYLSGTFDMPLREYMAGIIIGRERK
jgi:hypothetical protein